MVWEGAGRSSTSLLLVIQRLLPDTVAFPAGGVILAGELSARRLLANAFGTSLLVWAAIISSLLLFIAVGNTPRRLARGSLAAPRGPLRRDARRLRRNVPVP